MPLQKRTVESITTEAGQTIDPVTILFEDFEPGKGRVTLICYGVAWTSYFGGMGKENTIKQFFLKADLGYLTNKMSDENHFKKSKDKYLMRVIEHAKTSLLQDNG